jgi:acyl carrier protein
METETQIQEFISSQLLSAQGRGDEPLTRDTSLYRTGIVDSFGLLALVQFLERQFGITIGDEDMVPENFENIATIAHFVAARRSDGNATRK